MHGEVNIVMGKTIFMKEWETIVPWISTARLLFITDTPWTIKVAVLFTGDATKLDPVTDILLNGWSSLTLNGLPVNK